MQLSTGQDGYAEDRGKGNIIIICPDIGVPPKRCQAIIWTNGRHQEIHRSSACDWYKWQGTDENPYSGGPTVQYKKFPQRAPLRGISMQKQIRPSKTFGR